MYCITLYSLYWGRAVAAAREEPRLQNVANFYFATTTHMFRKYTCTQHVEFLFRNSNFCFENVSTWKWTTRELATSCSFLFRRWHKHIHDILQALVCPPSFRFFSCVFYVIFVLFNRKTQFQRWNDNLILLLLLIIIMTTVILLLLLLLIIIIIIAICGACGFTCDTTK